MPQYTVVQRGARRNYAVPLLLQGADMLERFDTDLAGNTGAGLGLALGRYLPILGPTFARLHRRRIPSEILAKTRTYPRDSLIEHFLNLFGPSDPASRFHRVIQHAERWGRSLIRAGFGQATHLYTMFGEGGPFLAAAKKAGLTVVAEVYIILSHEHVLKAERAAYPTWEPEEPDYTALRSQWVEREALLEDVDCYLCPSEIVRQDLVSNWGIDPSRTAVVPYGIDPQWLSREPVPQVGRILFVGTAELRKGIHHLAHAASILYQQGHRFEFRIAGHVSNHVRNQSACRHLTFLGRIPRDQIHHEYQKADIFVLPSLAEGSAEATYEALASALPVVTTPASGSVVTHEQDGLLVPVGDPTALATSIESIIMNRPLRMRMATAARQSAATFTWQKYGERLISTLSSIQV